MVSSRWKGQEREVAKFFGVTRNVHGRGDTGSLKSDVVVNCSKWTEQNSIKVPYFTHFFIEVKYSKGTEGRVFKLMEDASVNSGAAKCKTTPIIMWKQFILFYLHDFNTVLENLIIAPQPRAHPKFNLHRFTITHQHTLVPGYIVDYHQQAVDDVKLHREKKDWKGLPFACMTSSKAKRVVIYDTSFKA